MKVPWPQPLESGNALTILEDFVDVAKVAGLKFDRVKLTLLKTLLKDRKRAALDAARNDPGKMDRQYLSCTFLGPEGVSRQQFLFHKFVEGVQSVLGAHLQSKLSTLRPFTATTNASYPCIEDGIVMVRCCHRPLSYASLWELACPNNQRTLVSVSQGSSLTESTGEDDQRSHHTSHRSQPRRTKNAPNGSGGRALRVKRCGFTLSICIVLITEPVALSRGLLQILQMREETRVKQRYRKGLNSQSSPITGIRIEIYEQAAPLLFINSIPETVSRLGWRQHFRSHIQLNAAFHYGYFDLCYFHLGSNRTDTVREFFVKVISLTIAVDFYRYSRKAFIDFDWHEEFTSYSKRLREQFTSTKSIVLIRNSTDWRTLLSGLSCG
ncbi:hypothetical protein CLF_104738 [Clonorchis sinensis]|uniref:Uncharacterized protein n=1 Tax=Clonorchis sinensis TaxID=79923 RepID=G7YC88_CLOSI|nr:hypothetical protein CLF_104738 [Clonorchis sinensis]